MSRSTSWASRFPIPALVLSIAAVGSAASAGVLIVGPGQPFASIQPAVNAAAEGDIVLVKSGTYPGFQITDKGVAIVADAGATVHVTGTIHVFALGFSKTVLLDRLIVDTAYTGIEETGYALRAVTCLGHLRVQGCQLNGSNGNPNGLVNCHVNGIVHGWDGVLLDGCLDVGISLTGLRGGNGTDLFEFPDCDGEPFAGDPGGSGLRAVNSNVSLYDGQTFGGLGCHAWWMGGFAGHGIELIGSTLFASNVIGQGGDGGDAWDYIGPTQPGHGGAGMFIDATSVARVLDASFTPGDGGKSLWGAGGMYSPIDGPGQLVPIAGSSKGLGMPRVLRELQMAPLTMTGNPGESAFLFVGTSTGAAWTPSLKGVFHLSGVLIGPVALGPMGGAGSVTIGITAPTLPPGLLGAEVHLQGVVTGMTVTLTSWLHLTILDASL